MWRLLLVSLFALQSSAYINRYCWQNTDCSSSTMYCNAGVCACTKHSVQIRDNCYKKINPSESGCQYQSQCEAAWPGTTCNKGTCECALGYRAERTRDGFVCVLQVGSDGGLISPGACPLPDIRLSSSIAAGLALQASGTVVKCTPGTTSTKTGQGCNAQNQYLGDIYDCISGTGGTAGQPKAMTGAGEGVCCPNKAFICNMPRMTGGYSGSTHTRYYYSAVNGACQSFTWRDGGASLANTNANNFGSLEHCESYCSTVCERGNPEYNSVASDLRQRVAKTCWGNGCGADHECTGSQDTRCCPSPSFICSNRGGRLYQGSVPSGPDKGFQPLTTSSTMFRWYFDAAMGRCQSFSYLGVGGNFNNFYTHQDCENACDKALCARGRPLKLTSGYNQQCSGDWNCPSQYSCNSNVCCPKDSNICKQGKVIGGCQHAVPRWWYSNWRRDCELFNYSGCMGNDNNFKTYDECIELRKNCF